MPRRAEQRGTQHAIEPGAGICARVAGVRAKGDQAPGGASSPTLAPAAVAHAGEDLNAQRGQAQSAGPSDPLDAPVTTRPRACERSTA